MAKVRVYIDQAALASLNYPGGSVHRFMDRLANDAAKDSRKAFKARSKGVGNSGRLARSIIGDVVDSSAIGVTTRIGTEGVPYARYVHQGTTGPIRTNTTPLVPVGASQGHEPVFAKQVSGQSANPFLRVGTSTALMRRGLKSVV